MLLQVSVLLMAAVACNAACPNGAPVYAQGVSGADQNLIIARHNKYRIDIANGLVNGQPRGINLRRLAYDNQLATSARVVSNTCVMNHIVLDDSRFLFNQVGQNLAISWSSAPGSVANWTDPIERWFNEYIYYDYTTNASPTNKVVGHYTQVVWANTYLVGCDFIAFYDRNKPSTPYAKMYSCNYGGAGNWKGEKPYKTGFSGCENLC